MTTMTIPDIHSNIKHINYKSKKKTMNLPLPLYCRKHLIDQRDVLVFFQRL
ncbi:hypothetical protein BofuT4_uP131630.1 [Botrytis cinerea T4]|uniref:Uncharacterized protein n=1 Tax=Botryotinia fuckeliana (strain T4) TaxID=999810 RepID=G2YQT5_BOTF4|nr:hypothetical protein BofuT4_uP131630.1 [Botrytis cinerea T4]